MANEEEKRVPVLVVKNKCLLSDSIEFCKNSFGATSRKTRTVDNHQIVISTADILEDQDLYGFSWIKNKNEEDCSEKKNSQSCCKLCSVIGGEHELSLCSDRETQRWMEIHERLLPFYEKRHLWSSLEEKSVQFTDYFRKLFCVKDDKLQELLDNAAFVSLSGVVISMARVLAVLRWTQVVFCVKPELNKDVEALKRYEEVFGRFSQLCNRLSEVKNGMHDLSGDMKLAATKVPKLLARLIGGIGVLRQPHPVLDEERAMDRCVMTELMYWKNYGIN